MRKDINIYVKASLAERPSFESEEWCLLDTSGISFTLDYVSNILSDIGSITSSRSFTIKLPRTIHNDKVLDLAVVPQYESRSRYKYLPCRCYVNDIDVMGEANLYLLDSDAANYQCCIVFGLLQYYREWLNAGKGLRDLEDHGEYILWNGKCAIDCGSIWWSNFPSRYESILGPVNCHNLASQFYALYNCGVTRDANSLRLFNLHPCVTLREIYERIISENNLNFVMPQDVLFDMENLAIVQVSRNQQTGQPHTESISLTQTNNVVPAGNGVIQSRLGGLCGRVSLPTSNMYRQTNGVGCWLYRGEGYVKIEWDFYLVGLTGGSGNVVQFFGYLFDSIYYTFGNLDCVRLAIYDYTTGETRLFRATSYSWSGASLSNIRFNGSYTINNSGTLNEEDAIAEMAIWIDPRAVQCQDALFGLVNVDIRPYFEAGGAAGNELFNYNGNTQVMTRENNNYWQYTYIEGMMYYPIEFQLIPNLPDIKQVDFIKAICQMYGLFPVVNATNSDQVDFVPFDILIEGRPKAYDWSKRLFEDDTDAPKKIAFRLGDFAQRNIIKYKDDENEKHPFHSEATLFVNDYTLEKEKVLIEFPWAATKGNRITQYELIEETDGNDPPTITYREEFTQCEYRVMRITEWQRQSDCANVAQFQNLDAEYILATYYTTYQAYILQPRVITERIRLLETEFKSLDMRVPVYLAKYGRYFAIKDIKWTVGNDYAECELLML